MNVLPSRPSRRWLLLSAVDHLYCATLPVSERIRLQSGSVCPAVYAVAIRDRADCAACRPLGGHDISPGDIHHGAGDIVVGLILLATLPARPSMWDICLRSLVCGIGFGCFQSPNNREMLSNVIREHASYASGVLSIMRTFGQCTGAAAVAVLLAADERSIHVALWSAAAASAVSVVVSASRLRKIAHPAETG